MRIEKIYFEQLFPTGQYANQRLGVEGTLQEGELYENAFAHAKSIVEAAFKSMNPEPLPPQTDYHSGPTPEIQVEKIEIGDLPTQIQSCKELKVLESYKLMVKGKSDLEKLYFDKLNELSK